MNIRVEDVIEMWKMDSEINDMALDEEAKRSGILHSKYLEMLSMARLDLQRQNLSLDVLLKDKWLYYNGKMNRDEIDSHGWSYDPLGGLKVLKGDMEKFYRSDEDIQCAKGKIEYTKELVALLEEIMSHIRWRNQTIKNIIEWKQFVSGI